MIAKTEQIEKNKYKAVCPICNTENVITVVPQKLRVLQLNKVCQHYKDLIEKDNVIKFE